MKLAALILDVDGTLAETETTHLKAVNGAFETMDLPWRCRDLFTASSWRPPAAERESCGFLSKPAWAKAARPLKTSLVASTPRRIGVTTRRSRRAKSACGPAPSD